MSEETPAPIAACTALATLDRWATRVVTVSSAEEIFAATPDRT